MAWACGWTARCRCPGLTPTTRAVRRDRRAAEGRRAGSEVFATDSIQALLPEAAAYADRAAGLLAIPLSRTPRDYVVLFRASSCARCAGRAIRKSRWSWARNGARLTPRKSFEAWSELVKGHAAAVHRRRAAASPRRLRIGMLEVLVRLSDSAEAERARAHERQELLIAELNHRVRNILALIRGLISQSRDQRRRRWRASSPPWTTASRRWRAPMTRSPPTAGARRG